MSKKQNIPTAEIIRDAYISEFLKRRADAEEFAHFTEVELAKYIRKYNYSTFSSIYECTDHRFYDDIRNNIAIRQEMRMEDDASDHLFSLHLKTYSQFLESKAFKTLFKQKINIEGCGATAPTNTFRKETEGERKHIDREKEVIRRNPKLRQQCLDQYGYQCQCCGMDFEEVYGEELGAYFIEVHHLQAISTYETDGIPESFVENLVPLCSNCHSMIHHIIGNEHPLRKIREAYKGVKKEIKVWKED